MTTEQQRIAISEWMGYKIERRESLLQGLSCLIHPDGHVIVSDEEEFQFDDIVGSLPDYPLDLNAMHEAEKKLSEEQDGVYFNWLKTLFCPDKCYTNLCGYVICATSQQRSEALCRTLWPERFQ